MNASLDLLPLRRHRRRLLRPTCEGGLHEIEEVPTLGETNLRPSAEDDLSDETAFAGDAVAEAAAAVAVGAAARAAGGRGGVGQLEEIIFKSCQKIEKFCTFTEFC